MQRRLSESTEKYQKVKKTAMKLSIMLNFQKRAFKLRVSTKTPKRHFSQTSKSEHFSWECPQKQDKSKFCKKVKNRFCIVNNRRWPPSQDLQKQKNWRIHNAGYQICKSSIWWKNAKSYDLRYLPRRLLRLAKRGGAQEAHFLRKLLWFYKLGKTKVLKIVPGKVGVRGGIGG